MHCAVVVGPVAFKEEFDAQLGERVPSEADKVVCSPPRIARYRRVLPRLLGLLVAAAAPIAGRVARRGERCGGVGTVTRGWVSSFFGEAQCTVTGGEEG